MAASVTTRRRKPGQARPPVVSVVVLLACAVYFILPLLAMARFAFQRVPMVRFNFSTLFDRWTLDSLSNAFSDPLFMPALTLSLKLAVGAILVTLGILLPTALWVHLRVPRARPLVEILSVLPYVVPPIALGGRRGGHVPGDSAVVPELGPVAHPLLLRAGHAVHLPRPRRRHPGHRPADPGRRVPQPRRGVAHDAVPRADPQPHVRHHRLGVPDRHRRAGRVHHRLAAAEADAAHLPRAVPEPGAAGRHGAGAGGLPRHRAAAGAVHRRHPPAGAGLRPRPRSTEERHGHLVLRRRAQGVRADRRARPLRPRGRGRRARQPPRPERLREDHRAAHRRRLRVARSREWCASTGSTSPTRRPTSGTWGWCSRATACSPTSTSPTTWPSGCAPVVSGRRTAPSGWARCWIWSSCRSSPAATRTSCRAASSSGWRWPGRWPSRPACCSSTSRSRRSTPRSACCCGTRSAASRPSSASRPCSSPTTRRRRSASRIASA